MTCSNKSKQRKLRDISLHRRPSKKNPKALDCLSDALGIRSKTDSAGEAKKNLSEGKLL